MDRREAEVVQSVLLRRTGNEHDYLEAAERVKRDIRRMKLVCWGQCSGDMPCCHSRKTFFVNSIDKNDAVAGSCFLFYPIDYVYSEDDKTVKYLMNDDSIADFMARVVTEQPEVICVGYINPAVWETEEGKKLLSLLKEACENQ